MTARWRTSKPDGPCHASRLVTVCAVADRAAAARRRAAVVERLAVGVADQELKAVAEALLQLQLPAWYVERLRGSHCSMLLTLAIGCRSRRDACEPGPGWTSFGL